MQRSPDFNQEQVEEFIRAINVMMERGHCNNKRLNDGDRGDLMSPGGTLKKINSMKCHARFLYERVCIAISRNLARTQPRSQEDARTLTLLFEVYSSLDLLLEATYVTPTVQDVLDFNSQLVSIAETEIPSFEFIRKPVAINLDTQAGTSLPHTDRRSNRNPQNKMIYEMTGQEFHKFASRLGYGTVRNDHEDIPAHQPGSNEETEGTIP